MSLLNRIAYSNGDPQRAIGALRLINRRLERELNQPFKPLSVKIKMNRSGLSGRLRLAINQNESRRQERNEVRLRNS